MRASQHLVASHNPPLNQFLASRRYRISIAGPFSTEETGRAVETALISALEPIFNENGGERNWRFRPLGVPVQFGDRQTAAELALPDFLTAQGPSPRPVLFVIVNTSDLAYPAELGTTQRSRRKMESSGFRWIAGGIWPDCFLRGGRTSEHRLPAMPATPKVGKQRSAQKGVDAYAGEPDAGPKHSLLSRRRPAMCRTVDHLPFRYCA